MASISMKFLILVPCVLSVNALAVKSDGGSAAAAGGAMVTDHDGEELQDMAKWKTTVREWKEDPSKPKGKIEDKEEMFDNTVGMYDFDGSSKATSIFRDAAMEANVRETYLSDDFETRFSDKTMLILPERLLETGDDEKVLAEVEYNLKSRVPIYWGGQLYEEEVRLENLGRLLSHYDETFSPTFKSVISQHDRLMDHMDEKRSMGAVNVDTPVKRMQETVDTHYYHDSPMSKATNINFAIAGPTKLLKTPGPDADGSPHMDEIYTVHVWGVNLESELSADYKKFVGSASDGYPAGRLNRKLYEDQVRENFALVFGAALLAQQQNPTKQRVTLRIPLIGLGAYLKTLNKDEPATFDPENYDKHFAILTFYKTIFEMAENTFAKSGGKVSTVLCVMKWDVPNGRLASKMLKETFGFDLTPLPAAKGGKEFDIGERGEAKMDSYAGFYLPENTDILSLEIEKQGNLFSFGTLGYSGADNLIMLANAWDSCSLIGNRMSLDPTVDGFLVADAPIPNGTFNPNDVMQNTSYLHNPMFNEYANGAESGKWVSVGTETLDLAAISTGSPEAAPVASSGFWREVPLSLAGGAAAAPAAAAVACEREGHGEESDDESASADTQGDLRGAARQKK